jgi:DNA-directed RNA polymerase specialized sigma24 family protein
VNRTCGKRRAGLEVPLYLAKGATSYMTHEFEQYLAPYEDEPTEHERAQQACRLALDEVRIQKPAYWSVLEAHTLRGLNFKACAAREGVSVAASQKRHQRALRYLQDTALRIKAGIETGTT